MDDDLDNIDWGLEDDAFNYDDTYEKWFMLSAKIEYDFFQYFY